MKKYICKATGILGLLLIFLGISGAYATFSDSVTVKNHIATGDINISLKEYQKRNGKETSYRNPVEILPGDLISKIPRITNLGMPCWIRAKISFQNKMETEEGFEETHIKGISRGWKKRGEYYYYTKTLNTGESVDFFTGVSVPPLWTEDHSGQKLQIGIQADAIQAANFHPDFQEMSPWGNQTVEKCIHETNGKTDCKLENVKLSVKFHGDAQKLLAVPDDFFRNFGDILPGDTKKDDVSISNTDKETVEIFFRTELKNQTKEQKDLLEKLTLTISMDGKDFYTGSLKSSSLERPVSLGKFKPQTEGNLTFSITAPKDLKNAYALRDASVNWIFTVNKKESSLTEQPSSPDAPESSAPVKTGDSTPVLTMILLLVASAALSIAYLKLKKGDSEV
ncbi:MAG: hypothetical protein KHY93_07240 [Clostridiales bacterium]|nr:hypothetical protein [Clostridiales bacterium]